MKILKNIILLPFLPLRLAWKWSSGAKATSSGAPHHAHRSDAVKPMQKGAQQRMFCCAPFVHFLKQGLGGWCVQFNFKDEERYRG